MPRDRRIILDLIIQRKVLRLAVHGEAKNFSLENQVKDYSPIPWHPGAIKYMTEHGVKM